MRSGLIPVVALIAVPAVADPVNLLLEDRYSLFTPEPLASGHRVTGGLIVNDQASYKLGEYTGLRDDDVYGLGAFFSGGSLSGVDYRLEGSDLGLEYRRLEGRFGFAHGIRLDVAYRERPHYGQDSIFTPFRQGSGNRWDLPADWVGAANVQGFTALGESLGERGTRTKRRLMEVNLVVPVNERLSLAADYQWEDKRGNQLTGAVFGVGGTQLGVRVPAEIDRSTQDLSLSFSYNADWGSLTGGYRYSHHDEQSDSLVVRNPFIRDEFAVPANYPLGYGRLAPPPDNSARVIFGKAVWRLGRTARLSLDLQRASHEQDADYLPYTINDLATPLALPAPEHDGERVNTRFAMAFTMRPTPRTNLVLRYRFRERDDRTDRLPYAFVLTDIQDQGTDPAAGDIRVNRPYSDEVEHFAVEGGYRFSGGWRLTAGLERETVERELLPVDKTEEDAGHLKLSYRLGNRVSGWLKWRRADRDSGEYVDNAAYLAGHPEAWVEANGTGAFINDPALRQFFMADRRRDERDLVLNWAATNATSVAFKYRQRDDEYTASDFGLTDARSRDLTLDLTYSPDRRFSLFGYISRARQERDQGGFQWQGFAPQTVLPPLRDNSARGWRIRSDSVSDTLGAGLEWALTPRLDLELEYGATRSDTEYDVLAGTALAGAPLPDVEMNWEDISARVRYQVRENLSVGAQYRYRDYATRDFALDGVGVDTLSGVLLSGARSPDFSGNTLLLSVTYGLH